MTATSLRPAAKNLGKTSLYALNGNVSSSADLSNAPIFSKACCAPLSGCTARSALSVPCGGWRFEACAGPRRNGLS
jgi:hypothetical protein